MIIRSVGERTTDLCRKLILSQGVNESDLNIVSLARFPCFKKCYEIGIRDSKMDSVWMPMFFPLQLQLEIWLKKLKVVLITSLKYNRWFVIGYLRLRTAGVRYIEPLLKTLDLVLGLGKFKRKVS